MNSREQPKCLRTDRWNERAGREGEVRLHFHSFLRCIGSTGWKGAHRYDIEARHSCLQLCCVDVKCDISVPNQMQYGTQAMSWRPSQQPRPLLFRFCMYTTKRTAIGKYLGQVELRRHSKSWIISSSQRGPTRTPSSLMTLSRR